MRDGHNWTDRAKKSAKLMTNWTPVGMKNQDKNGK
jgi:hypothetical protein